MAKIDVLVLAACAPELEGFHSLLGESLSAPVCGLNVKARAVGIGLPMAAATTGAYLESVSPKATVFVGTCASYPGRGLAPKQLVVGQSVMLADATTLEGRARLPDPMRGMAEPNRVLTSALMTVGIRPAKIASPLAMTTEQGLASRFSQQLDADVEQGEAFGVGMACASRHVPFAIVLGVSHEMGPAGYETWRLTHRAAVREAARLVAFWLQSGAVGVPRGQTG